MTSTQPQQLETASGLSRRLLAVLVGLLVSLALIVSGAAPASAQNAVGHQPQNSILAVGPTSAAAQTIVGVHALPQLRLVSATGVAADTGGQVLKGPIADAVPKNLPQQLALNAAKEGRGTQIMANLGDTPRLVANYGEGDWVKMQYVLRGTDSNITVHYFRNLTTKMDVEFKFP